MDPEEKKRALRMLTYGLYVMTARSDNEIAAGAVTWLSQASFNPPLLMAAVRVDSRLHTLIEKSGAFALSILSAGHKELASAFFRPTQVEGERINGYLFVAGQETNAPLLLDAPASLEARVTGAVRGGDHTVFVAEVVDARLRDPQAKSLVMWDTGWFYSG
jgi:flavin reductase (DIM6/NTAB) family NADH-FMN oxidoreductase RutF